MSDRITTIEGLFGEKIHYKDGKKIGESWPGVFSGSYNHYDQAGTKVGYSRPGLFADQVHYNNDHERQGYSNKGFFGLTNHFDKDGYVGSSIDTVFGEETDLEEDAFEPYGCNIY